MDGTVKRAMNLLLKVMISTDPGKVFHFLPLPFGKCKHCENLTTTWRSSWMLNCHVAHSTLYLVNSSSFDISHDYVLISRGAKNASVIKWRFLMFGIFKKLILWCTMSSTTPLALVLTVRVFLVFQLVIPIEQFQNSHVRIMFKHRSANEGNTTPKILKSLISRKESFEPPHCSYHGVTPWGQFLILIKIVFLFHVY